MDREELVASVAELISRFTFAGIRVGGGMGRAIERTKEDTARRTAERIVAFLESEGLLPSLTPDDTPPPAPDDRTPPPAAD